MELKHQLYRRWLQGFYLWHQALLVVKEIGAGLKWLEPMNLSSVNIPAALQLICRTENALILNLQIHTKKRNRLTTTRLNKLVFIQFNTKLINKKEKIKAKKINDVLLSSETTEAQGFLHEDGDECALVIYRDEEDEEMEGTGVPWSVIGEAVGAEEQLELRRSARVRELYEGEEFDSEEEEFQEDEDDGVEPY